MNPENLIPNSERTPSQRKANASKAGKASAKARRERKTIAEALRLVLNEEANSDGLTRQEAIVARVVKRLYDEGDIRDLKVLADVLGESVQNIDLKGIAPIVAMDAEDAAKIQTMLDAVKARKDGTK